MIRPVIQHNTLCIYLHQQYSMSVYHLVRKVLRLVSISTFFIPASSIVSLHYANSPFFSFCTSVLSIISHFFSFSSSFTSTLSCYSHDCLFGLLLRLDSVHPFDFKRDSVRLLTREMYRLKLTRHFK